MIARWPLHLHPHIQFRKKKEGRKNERVIPLSGKQKLAQKSFRLLFMCPRPEFFLWPPMTVRESERANISVGHFGIRSKIGVLIVKRRSTDIV